MPNESKDNNNFTVKDTEEVKPLKSHREELNDIKIRVYSKRWFMVILCTLFIISNSLQWMQFTIILSIATRYFNVSSMSIAWTNYIRNVLFVVFLYPMVYVIHKIDLRYTFVVSSVTVCIASWVKYLIISPDHFVAIFIAQTVISFWELVVWICPVYVAAYWFGIEQISTGTALATSGLPIGMALFSYLTPTVVRNHENVDDITGDFESLFLGIALLCTLVAVAIILFFENEPMLPPSKSRALQKMYVSNNFVFMESFKRIITNKNMILLCNAHGIHIAVMTCEMALLNPLYLAHFENGEENAGVVALVVIACGVIGSIVFGRVQDRFKWYKYLSVFLYACSILIVVLFAVSLFIASKWTVLFVSGLLGFVTIAYTTTGLETCVEVTYPEPSATSVSILNLTNQLYGIIVFLIVDKIMSIYGDLGAHICFCALLTIGLISNSAMDNVRMRQDAVKNS